MLPSMLVMKAADNELNSYRACQIASPVWNEAQNRIVAAMSSNVHKLQAEDFQPM